MKSPLLIPLALLAASSLSATTIDMVPGEWADYSSLGALDVFGPSSVTDGTMTLTMLNQGARRFNADNYTGATLELDYAQGTSAGDTSTSLSESISENKFLTIQLSDTGSAFNWDSVSVTLWRNGAGAADNYVFLYDDEGTGYDTGDMLGSPTTVSGSGNSGSQTTITFDASTIVSSATTAEVRVYFWGGSSGVGDTHMTAISASYTAIPEPGTYALVAGFLGLGAILVRQRRR